MHPYANGAWGDCPPPQDPVLFTMNNRIIEKRVTDGVRRAECTHRDFLFDGVAAVSRYDPNVTYVRVSHAFIVHIFWSFLMRPVRTRCQNVGPKRSCRPSFRSLEIVSATKRNGRPHTVSGSAFLMRLFEFTDTAGRDRPRVVIYADHAPVSIIRRRTGRFCSRTRKPSAIFSGQKTRRTRSTFVFFFTAPAPSTVCLSLPGPPPETAISLGRIRVDVVLPSSPSAQETVLYARKALKTRF